MEIWRKGMKESVLCEGSGSSLKHIITCKDGLEPDAQPHHF